MNRQSTTQTLQQKPTATPTTGGLLQRKCACGNHTIAGSECAECGKTKRFGLQTKLKVNEPGDIYEQEADRIADQVMATPAHHAVSGAPQRIQRASAQSNEQTHAAPASVDQALASPGRPLEPALRQDMEQRFGYDFSRVRVHSSTAAEQSAHDVNAHAYTVGQNIVFGAGRFAPGMHEGRRLLAHELTHVVQQSGADGIRLDQSYENRGLPPFSHADGIRVSQSDEKCGLSHGLSPISGFRTKRLGLQAKLVPVAPGDAYEQETDRVADEVMQMNKTSVRGPLLQRRTPGPGEEQAPPQQAEEAAPPEGEAQPQPLCSPKGMTRDKFLKEPGATTSEFGLTVLDLSAVTNPELSTEKSKGGVRIKSTSAALPTIPSVFTGNDTFTEGEAHFIGQNDGECPSKKYPIRWTITPQGAAKIGEGEQEHCADFQQAFDVSLKRYADAVNTLAQAGKTYGSEKKAEKAVVKAVGAAPADWNGIFSCLARKTKLRDSNWHTPRTTTREPKLATNCAFVSAFITGTSLPQVGQHASADIIKDCGETGAAGGAKAKPAREKGGEIAMPDLSGAIWGAWESEQDETALLQRKVGLVQENDPLEQEADRIADRVKSASAPATTGGALPDIQRIAGLASAQTGAAPAPSVDRALASSGRPLEPALRHDMEQRFGHDFSRVRVHSGAAAEVSAKDVNAHAYTVGRDIVFGAGRFAPGSHAGRWLLAHELTHVLQQRNAARTGEIELGERNSDLEREADTFASQPDHGATPDTPS